MRTIKRYSIDVNSGKQKTLFAIAQAYAQEKQHWLRLFQQTDYLPFIKKNRIIRDRAVRENYQSHVGLQARMWKLALQDAADTMDKYWKSLFDKVKRDVFKSILDANQRHYLLWIIKDYARFANALMLHIGQFKDLDIKSRKQTISYLIRKIRKYKNQLPKVKLARSFILDDNCYDLFEHAGRQYINLMTLIPRQRVAIPLSGFTPIKGNIRIILQNNRVEVHYSAEIKSHMLKPSNDVIAVDFGYSEVMTDIDGEHYGNGFGHILTQASDELKLKMQKRHQLHALHKKYMQSDSYEKRKKAKHILKNNLGKQKLEETNRKIKETINRNINESFNKLAKKEPLIVISENLSHAFHFDYGHTMNRRLSAWVKGKLKERLSFKALAKGFGHEQVNAAYTSQTCPPCGYVDRKNRKGDKFQCLNCGHVGHADCIAALNLLSRYFDREITRFTPYREVKRILLERFHRRLEIKTSRTVNGRIPDTKAS